ncbi:MAG: hypothetical protein R8G33_03515 [Gammaproteobacteria bacterium]|nr:hypothetical protein [Gammaproteobacteria bacterium]
MNKTTNINDNNSQSNSYYAHQEMGLDSDDIQSIMSALSIKAKNGDVAAAKLILDRTMPTLKPETLRANIFEGIDDHSDLCSWYLLIIKAVTKNEISIDQANNYLSLVKNRHSLVMEDALAYDSVCELVATIDCDEDESTLH